MKKKKEKDNDWIKRKAMYDYYCPRRPKEWSPIAIWIVDLDSLVRF